MHTADSVLVSWLPYFHDMGLVYGILTPLHGGFTAHLMASERFIAQPLSWLRAIAAVGGTHTAAPNFAYALCADRAADLAPETDLSSLRFALNGAEPVRCDTVRRFETAFAPFGLRPSVVVPGYGLAEATLKVTSGRCYEGMQGFRFERDALAAGRVVPGDGGGVELASCGISLIDTQIVIVDPVTRRRCAPDAVGEIWVAGPSVAGGYWHREEETRETFQAYLAAGEGPWLRTGDLGFIHAGSLFVTSRLKDLIIVGGRNLYSHDLEDSIEACHADIRKGRVFAAALAIDDEVAEGVLIGAEVRNRCNETAARAVVSAIRSVLMAEHQIAATRVVLLRRGSVLRTSSGKIRRAATRDALLRGELQIIADFGAVAAAVSDDILSEIMRFVPGACAEPAGKLIDLGLDSLSAARLAASVRARFGVELTFARLFAASAESLQADIANAQKLPAPAASSVRHCDSGQPFELSEMQQAYWIGQHSGVPLGSVRPHIRIDFKVDHAKVPELSSRLRDLVASHSALRISVRGDGRAVIDPQAYDPVIQQYDFRGMGEPAGSEGLHTVRERLARDDERPLAACFTRLTDTTTILHLRLGLLAGDVRSLLLLARELIHGGPNFSLPYIAAVAPPPVPAERREAWDQRIRLIAPPPQLPVATAVADIVDPKFIAHRRELPEDLSMALTVRAQTLGVTISSLCIALFADVLRLWSASPELTLNVTSNTRDRQYEQAVGDYTSNILLSLRECHDSFAAFARAVQQQMWADLDEPWCTGVSMLRELGRRSGAPVLMPVVLTSLLSGDRADDLAVLDAIGPVVDVSNPTPQVSLHNILAWRGQCLMVMWEHVEQVFPAGVVEAMFAVFMDALAMIATTPSAVELPVIAKLPASQEARRRETNATFADRAPRRLEAPFVRHGVTNPDAIAVISADGTTTYGALLRDAEDIASALQRGGVRRGDVVAAIVEPGPRAVAALIGIELAGAVYLPIEPSWPQSRIHELLYEAKARHVVAMGEVDLPVPSLRLDRTLDRAKPDPVANAPDDAAYVIFTSGSTGRPKGVVMTHEAAANTIDDINERFLVGRNDRVLCVSSLAFDLSVYDVFGLLAVGGTIVFPERARDPDAIAHALRSAAVTIWNSVPAVLELLLDVANSRSPHLRLALLSGDWIAPALPERIREAFPSIQAISLGGATEAAIWSVIHPIVPADAVLSSIPYGRPLSNQQCFVRAPDGRDRPDRVAGELLLGGRGLAVGYCGNDAETARHFFIDAGGRRVYRTGDLARWMPTGELKLLGRIDDQVKVQGYRIELGEIEAAAMRSGCVSQAVASVVRRSGATAIQLHVVASPDSHCDVVAAVRAELVRHLPTYMRPHHVGVLDTLPLTANGKVDRKRLSASPLPPPPRMEPSARRNALLETVMMDAFAEVVGIDIDPQQPLFEAGATSLHLVRLRALLASRGVAVPPLVDFFSLATIRAIASSSRVSVTEMSNENDVAGTRAYRQRMRARAGSI